MFPYIVIFKELIMIAWQHVVGFRELLLWEFVLESAISLFSEYIFAKFPNYGFKNITYNYNGTSTVRLKKTKLKSIIVIVISIFLRGETYISIVYLYIQHYMFNYS